MATLFSIFTVIFFIVIVSVPSLSKARLYACLSLNFTPFFYLGGSLFGFNLPFLCHFILLGYLILYSIYQENIFIAVLKRVELKALTIFYVFLFINHVTIGSSLRSDAFDNSFLPILYLIIIFSICQLMINQKFNFDYLLNCLRKVIWLNIISGGYTLVFSGMTLHDTIYLTSFNDQVGFNSNEFAIQCVFIIIIELYFLRNEYVFKNIIILFPVYFCLQTYSRSGVMALFLVIIYWTIFNKNFIKSLGQLLLLSSSLILFNMDYLIERFSLVFLRYDVTGSFNTLVRFQFMMRGIYMFLDHPIFGTGVGTYWMYRHAYPQFTPILGNNDSFNDSHNLYAQILAETGLIGGALFFYFLYRIFKNIRSFKFLNFDIYRLLMSIFILFLFGGLFSHDKYKSYLFLPLVLSSFFFKDYFYKKYKINI